MNQRKETPDVLSEILGGETSEPIADENVLGGVPPSERPKRVSKPRRTSTSQRRKVSKSKWEYKVVSLQEYKGWRPRFVNGVELKDWTEGPTMHEYISALGQEGWELTTASAGEKLYGNLDKYQLFFKRQP